MTGPLDDDLFHLEEAPPTGAAARWGRTVVVGLVVALVVAVIAVTATLRREGPAAATAAAPDTAGSPGRSAVPAAATPPAGDVTGTPSAPPVSAAPTLVPTPAPPNPVKDTSTPMPPAERAAAEAELQAFVDAHLQSPVRLESPAEWARWGTDAPVYADDVDGCPTIAGRLGQLLGGRWTYTYGTLPGPGGCTWTPVPWVPEADPTLRYFEGIAFTPGADVHSTETHTNYQAAGTACPEVAAPAVGEGAFVVRCQDPSDLTYELVLPDAAGRGVWSLSTYAGHAQTAHDAPGGLLALLTVAQAAY